MARYRGPRCRICRREGVKLFLKGERCHRRGGCPIDKSINPRNYPPGEHGLSRRQKPSDYAIRLREKQKLRKMYGILEKQFRVYFRKAARQSGVTGDNLLRLLEMRLDNVAYRLGFAMSRSQARQMVSHGLIRVNGRKVDIPSCQVKSGDIVTLKDKAKSNEMVKYSMEWNASRLLPEWLSFDAGKVEGKIESEPTRDMISVPLEEQLVVEFYSRV